LPEIIDWTTGLVDVTDDTLKRPERIPFSDRAGVGVLQLSK
jgi:hypothetical protein